MQRQQQGQHSGSTGWELQTILHCKSSSNKSFKTAAISPLNVWFFTITAKLWGICLNIPQAAAAQTSMQPLSLFSHKPYTDMKSSYADNESASPLTDCSSLSHLSQRRHTQTTTTQRERIIFSLYCNASESLNRKCQQGNLPSRSCVLRETLESVETAVPWLVLCCFGDRNHLPHWKEKTRQNWPLPRFFFLPHHSHSGSLKGTDKTRSTIIGRGVWKSILLRTWGAPPKRFHIPASTHGFWQKKKKTTSISEWYELSISQPQFFSSPSVLFPVPYLWHTTPFPLC